MNDADRPLPCASVVALGAVSAFGLGAVKASTASMPPKPNELESAARIARRRAVRT